MRSPRATSARPTPSDSGDNAPAGVLQLLFDGDLQGCYYTDTSDPRVIPAGDGRYRLIDRGEETFIGTRDGAPVTFRTRYVVKGLFQGDPLATPPRSSSRGLHPRPLRRRPRRSALRRRRATGVVHHSGRIRVG